MLFRSPAAPLVGAFLALPAETHRGEPTTGIDGRDQERGGPCRLAVNGDHRLHHGHDRCTDALAEFQRDYAITQVRVAPVGLGNER